MLLFSVCLYAQENIRTDSLKADTSHSGAVVVNESSNISQDSSSAVSDSSALQDSSAYIMHKSPLGAVLRSAAVPGWGQFYNKSYWKIPVVWGFIAFYSYYWIDNNKKYRSTIDDYTSGRRPQWTNSDYERFRNFYRDQRDLFAIYIGITYALNLLDAYVDAHLFDFSVDEDPGTRSARLSVKFHF